MFDSQQHRPHLGHDAGSSAPTQSTRGRKRKNAAGGPSSSNHNQSKMHRQQQQQLYGQHPAQYGQRGGAFTNQMPPPSMHHSLRQSTGMGLGLPLEEESSDFILDELDRLNPRSIAMARYKRHHELLSLVFDARRVDKLEPPASPYAEVDQAVLKEQLQKTEEEMIELREAHSKKMKVLKEDYTKQDALLHSVKKSKVAPSEPQQESEAISFLDAETVGEVEAEEEEEWAKEPSKGQVMGVGYIRVSTPEEVRALLPKAPVPAPAPIAVAPQETSASVLPAAMEVGDDQVPLPIVSTESTIEEAQKILSGEDTAMTSITIEGVEAEEDDADADEDNEDDEEEDDEDVDVDDDEDAEESEHDEDGQFAGEDEDGDDADADADGDADAEGDADADADAEEEGDAVAVQEEQSAVPLVEETAEPIKIEEPLEQMDTTDLDTVMQETADDQKESEEAARIEQEREIIDEVNRQHDVHSEEVQEEPISISQIADSIPDQQAAANEIVAVDESTADVVARDAEPVE